MYRVTLLIDWWGKTIPAVIDYSGYHGEVVVDYRGSSITIFRWQESNYWFNPDSLPYVTELTCSEELSYFSVELEVLRYILVHEPFAFPLNDCRQNHLKCDGNCCEIPPSLTLSEVDSFLASGQMECLDFSRNFVALAKNGGYCCFFDSDNQLCLLKEQDRQPKICQWMYCQFLHSITNWGEMVRYIRCVLHRLPTSKAVVIYDIVPQ